MKAEGAYAVVQKLVKNPMNGGMEWQNCDIASPVLDAPPICPDCTSSVICEGCSAVFDKRDRELNLAVMAVLAAFHGKRAVGLTRSRYVMKAVGDLANTFAGKRLAAGACCNCGGGLPDGTVGDIGKTLCANCFTAPMSPNGERMVQHDSDCATHNEPAYTNGPCDCTRR